MARISGIDPEAASPAVRAAIDAHLADGHRMTNEKLTLLRNVTAFNALEAQSYALDRELQRLVGKRAADFFEYAISLENDCLVCSAYFTNLLKQNGIEDFDRFDFTDDGRLLIAYGRAMADDPKSIPDALFEQLRARFSEEALVVITAMGALMIANNVFNDALRVDPEPIL